MRSLEARAGVTTARVDAVSAALPAPAVTPLRRNDVLVPGDPSPAVVTEQTWTLGTSPALRAAVSIGLTGVRRATLLMTSAGLPAVGCSSVTVTSDGATSLVLQGLSGAATAAPFPSGTRTVSVQSSRTAPPRVAACGAALAPLTEPPTGDLAATGASTPLAALGLALTVLLAGRRLRGARSRHS